MLLLIVLLLLVLLVVGLYYYLRLVVIAKLPHNAPRFAKKSNNQLRMVFAGDSNTHGNMGYNWVDDFAKTYNQHQVINAGVNADLAVTLQRRLSEILDLDPHFVTILIGTNDVNATMSQANYKRYLANGKIEITDEINLNVFAESLKEIVKKLKAKTNTKIALISIPLIGEDLDHLVNKKADQYTEIIQKIAQHHSVSFLDFRGLQKKNLLKSKSQPSYEGYFRKMQVALVLHYYMGWSWDRISKFHGTQFTHDLLHQNAQSAKLLKGLIENWLEENGIVK